MPAKIRVRMAREELRRVLAADSGRYITLLTNRVNNRAKVLSPVRTGTLRSRHTPNVRTRGDRVIGTVTVKVNYAAVVHEGHGGYVVLPKRFRSRRNPRRRAALRFVVGGKVYYRLQVRIPPARGRPWLRTALYEIAGPAGFRLHVTRPPGS